MAKKHEEVRQLLERATEEEICIVYFLDGRARVDFAPHADTPQAMAARTFSSGMKAATDGIC